MQIGQIQIGDKMEDIIRLGKHWNTYREKKMQQLSKKKIYPLVDLIEGFFLRNTACKKFVYIDT